MTKPMTGWVVIMENNETVYTGSHSGARSLLREAGWTGGRADRALTVTGGEWGYNKYPSNSLCRGDINRVNPTARQHGAWNLLYEADHDTLVWY